jgi:hypothetical protein
MDVETLRALVKQSAPAGVADTTAARLLCPLDALAPVVSALLRRSITGEQLREKAIAFGLARQPPVGAPLSLTPEACSRLLLSAFRCPAQVSIGTLEELRRRLRKGWLAFLPLAVGALPDDLSVATIPVMFQVHLPRPRRCASSTFLVSRPGAPHETARPLTAERFQLLWNEAGRLLLLGAHSWSDLPATGTRFFGGSRNRDGTYYWEMASYETDAEGHILYCERRPE